MLMSKVNSKSEIFTDVYYKTRNIHDKHFLFDISHPYFVPFVKMHFICYENVELSLSPIRTWVRNNIILFQMSFIMPNSMDPH